MIERSMIKLSPWLDSFWCHLSFVSLDWRSQGAMGQE